MNLGACSLFWLWIVVSFLAAMADARAETIVLSSGGRIAGTINLGAEDAAGNVIIQLSTGGTLQVPREQVARVISQTDDLEPYFEMAAQHADTASDQWKLARWCRDHGYQQQLQLHGNRVLELDPNFGPARSALGHIHRRGRWMSQEEIMRERGYFRFQGEWMNQQQIALAVAAQEQKDRQIAWRKRLFQWRAQLGEPREGFVEIDFDQLKDADAMPGLIALLKDETRPKLILGYIATIGQIESGEATQFLMDHAIHQNNPDFREACLRQVLLRRDPRMVDFFVGFLNHYDNVIVNRAADALAELEYRSAIVPLASALQTRHLASHSTGKTYFYTKLGRDDRFDPEGPSSSFRTMTLDQYLTLSRGSFDTVAVRNYGVHNALRKICDGEDLGYNPDAWKTWYRSSHAPKAPKIRLARDD